MFVFYVHHYSDVSCEVATVCNHPTLSLVMQVDSAMF